MKHDELEKLSYEEALEKLELVVKRLEDENVPLEESLALFQEGIALSRYCRDKLAQIEYRVEYLLKEEETLQKEVILPAGELPEDQEGQSDPD